MKLCWTEAEGTAAARHPSSCVLPHGHDGPHRFAFAGDIWYMPTGKDTYRIEVATEDGGRQVVSDPGGSKGEGT